MEKQNKPIQQNQKAPENTSKAVSTEAKPKPKAPEKKQKTKGVGAIIFLSIFVIILAAGSGLLLRQYFEVQHEAETAIQTNQKIDEQRKELIAQLDELESAFQKLSIEYTQMEEVLRSERARVRNLRNELAGQGPGADPEAQAKIEELEKLLAEYQEQADLLKSENLELANEKSQIENTLNQKAALTTQLEREKSEMEEQLEKASILSVSNIEATGIRTKRRGDVPTDRAKRTSKIQVCFTINQNLVATPGNRDFYVRIIDPNNNVLTLFPDDTFKFEGEELAYSAQRTINYQNNAQDVCLTYSQDDKFEKGYYNIAIFAEGYEMGYKMLELR